MKKIKKILLYIRHPQYIQLFFDKIGFIKMSDERYLKEYYKKVFSNDLDLVNPKTFNEKLNWLKLYDRKSIYTTMVDKYDAKKYVANIIGEGYIIPTIGVYDKFDDIDFNKLPEQFVMKCTHDSGGLVVCKDKSRLNIDEAKKKTNKSLKNNFYYIAREWPYKNVKPRIIVEKYMGDNLNDYKIFCFNGEPKFTLVCSNRVGHSKNTDFFDNNWKHLPFTRTSSDNSKNEIPKPTNLNEMLEIARKLSKDIPFVRVDLYDINNKIYFGEMTFYPSGGFEGFKPEEWDRKLGDMLELPKEKITNEK